MPDQHDIDDAVLDTRWQALQTWLSERFGKATSIESILFLIGIQSRGRGYQPKLKKEIKQDLIMEGTCCVFETLGIYQRIGADSDGFTIWQQTQAPARSLSLEEQERLLRVAILTYFEQERFNDAPTTDQ